MSDPAPLEPLDPALRTLIDLAESDLSPVPADVDAGMRARLDRSLFARVAASKLALAGVVAAVAVGAVAFGLREAPPPAPVDVAPAASAAPEAPAETALIDAARAALRRGDLDDAARDLDEHARTYPHGALAEERDALAALLDLRKGASPDDVLSAFSRAHPGSVHRAMLEEAVRQMR